MDGESVYRVLPFFFFFVPTLPWEQLQKLWINLVGCFTVFRRHHLYQTTKPDQFKSFSFAISSTC